MLERNYQSREKQTVTKMHGLEPFHRENEPYTRNEPMQTEKILKKEAAHHSSIQSLAYRIHYEQGGTALDNWLEAERILRNNYK
jgi:hypothetical protein